MRPWGRWLSGVVAIGLLCVGALAQETISSSEKHRESWELLVNTATTTDGGYARYALYASRSLAVTHPEVYLVGDRWFYELASTVTGFGDCYRETNVLSSIFRDYGAIITSYSVGATGGIIGTDVLDFSSINLHEYSVVSPDRIVPGPYESFVDHRLGPLAVTLKTEGRVVTTLELAEIAYFQAIARGVKESELFLVACVDGSGYLLEGDCLVSMVSGEIVEAPTGSPYLIFNAGAVWYPLMERDDSAANQTLRQAVERLATPVGTPNLNVWETELVRSLRVATELTSDEQRDMAAIAATRTTGWRCHPAYSVWLQFVPETDFSSFPARMGIIREFDRLANTVSPAAAYLYGFLVGEGTLEERVRQFGDEYLERIGVRRSYARGWRPSGRLEAWGHIWPCGLMEHTIDDGFRARTGHCVSQAHMAGAVLDMAGIPHVVVNFAAASGSRMSSHHFILSQDGAFLIDDGIVNFRGTDDYTDTWGPLLTFAVVGEWARTITSGRNTICGSVPEQRLAELLRVCDDAIAGRFPLRFALASQMVSLEEFLDVVEDIGVQEVRLR